MGSLTKEGYEMFSSYQPGKEIMLHKRYVNLKMEEELKTFKVKIKTRFENHEITGYQFPRMPSASAVVIKAIEKQ